MSLSKLNRAAVEADKVLTRGPRNPSWSWDEIVLALELYARNPASPPGKTSVEVIELSEILNRLHRLQQRTANLSLRNPAGIYLKMMNLRALDPTFTTQGNVGMKAGSKLDKKVWDEYFGDWEQLVTDAAEIRQRLISVANTDATAPQSMIDYQASEGTSRFVLHKRYERNAKLVSLKRQEAQNGRGLICEACDFNFEEVYGEMGRGYAEVHHTKPLHLLEVEEVTTLSDLAVLCANCHRMVHRKRPPLDVPELRALINRLKY